MFALLCRVYMELIRLEIPLLLHDFASIHELVRSCRTEPVKPSHAAHAEILRAVDLASIFYFKEVQCLQRSTVTTRLLRKQGIPASILSL